MENLTLDSPYTLHAADQKQFHDHGHVVLRGLASPDEVHAARARIQSAVDRLKHEARDGAYQKPLADRDTYHKAFLQLENLWTRDESVRAFSLSRRFAGAAAALLGVERVRIYHDQALFKEPGGGHTPWHQDQYYWPLDTDQTVTLWMPLVDASIETGSLVFADGTHRMGPLANLAISDASETAFRDAVIERELPLRIYELRAGDATWHAGWTLHKAPGNASDRMREAMTVIYVADGARVSDWKTEKHPRERDKWMPGCEPGELVASPINPIVYP